MNSKIQIAAGVATIMAILAGGVLWTSSVYAKVESIPRIKAKQEKQEEKINLIHRNLCKMLGQLGLDGSGC